ncbi:hypothetical protein C8R45DRAFT_1006583 [Mycena sanguinolenta]|nr:hypothetical protein C8R45DRAFT_1006583 [Mycena sanguinolenta]
MGDEGHPGNDHVNTPGELHPPGAAGAEYEAEGIGGKGGTGEGLKLGEPMVSIRDGAQVPGLNVTMDEFCRRYCLGEEIAKLLRHHGFGSPRSFQEVEDLELHKAGFKVGHIAELKWALRKTAGKDLLVRSGKPELHGGIGGMGGHGGQHAGEGGKGESAVVPGTHIPRFAKIWGGIGGQGGTTGPKPPSPAAEGVNLWERVRGMLITLRILSRKATETEGTYVFGGVGGKGGGGTRGGGEGGIGEASEIPIGAVSMFARIFGGIGGEGGFGRIFGGRGGIGRGSVFHEVLGHPHGNTLNAPPTLLANYSMAKHPNEDKKLRHMLSEQGFVTVGALFVVTGKDLAEVGFNIGHIAALKGALREFNSKYHR